MVFLRVILCALLSKLRWFIFFKCEEESCGYNNFKTCNSCCALCLSGGSEGEERGAEGAEGLGEKVPRREARTCKEVVTYELENS